MLGKLKAMFGGRARDSKETMTAEEQEIRDGAEEHGSLAGLDQLIEHEADRSFDEAEGRPRDS